MEGSEYLELHGDEQEHLRDVPEHILKGLLQFDRAAAISINGWATVQGARTPSLNSPRGLILLLLAKSASNLRFAAIGTRLGYYSGAYATLRSAFEALSYAALFHKDPDEINRYFLAAAWKPSGDRAKQETNDEQSEQAKRARQALLDQISKYFVAEHSNSVRTKLRDFRQVANRFLHPNLLGLAEEFGMDVDYLLPDEFQEELEKTGGDFEKALQRFKVFRKFGKPMSIRTGAVEDDIIPTCLNCRFDNEIVHDLAIAELYIAYLLLHMTGDVFAITDKDFKDNHDAWHDALLDLDVQYQEHEGKDSA